MKISNNLVGSTGEYFVCGELGQRGILGLITPKNNPLYDIVATNEGGIHTVLLQVKTMASTNKQGWKLNKSICVKKNIENLFVVLVLLNGIGQPIDYFIYKYDDLAEIVERNYNRYMSVPKRDGSSKKDTDMRWLNIKDFTKADWDCLNHWDVLGFG
ncbi:aspartate-ammonia lyase [Paenibacillus oleatilyticus]|uniref:aspartate-ammonia lyase n=1 Tax=Paenibacillus oleatilyticus TaxID=2594886 RepID=UPI001C1F9635|nr:aspartate-ammonia lyase [Paenibacillus oleatilyticus]MBU7320501.1 aspartate-ammonia lyase [Paenibacillus oleatilyticus]